MHRPLSLLLLCLLSACSLTGTTPTPTPTPTSTPTPSLGPLTATYRATDLGTLGGTTSYAYAVSADGGVVVGYNLTATGHTRAFMHQNGAMTDLGTLGGPSSYARGVSADGGTVVGYSTDAGGRQRAFSYQGGVMRDLGTLGGETAMARAVSADGSVIVGYSADAAGQTRAFRLQDGVMTDLGTLGGGHSSAHAVSADGKTIVGESTDAQGRKRAFVYQDGTMHNLGTLPGDATSVAWGVSADGQVIVGESSPAGGATRVRAFRVQDGVMTPLGALGSGHGVAFGVSGDGTTTVGFSQNAAGRMRPFAARDGVVSDLGTLSGLDTFTGYARNSSADGQVVVGYSRTANKEMHATLWRADARTAKTVQTVVFTSVPPPSARVGGLYTPTAAASSGLGVTFGASGACAAELSATGSSVRLTGVGTCTVTALQAGSAAFETASAAQTFGVAAAPVAAGGYVIDFERTPVGRPVYRVDRSSGLVYLGSGIDGTVPRTSSVPVVGRRRLGNAFLSGQRAVVARLWGSDRLTVAGPGTPPDAQGGRLELSFANFGPAGVTLTSLSVSNLTAGAYLTLSYAGGGTSRHPLGTTPVGGSLTVTPNAGRVTRLAVFAPNAFALDNVVFTLSAPLSAARARAALYA